MIFLHFEMYSVMCKALSELSDVLCWCMGVFDRCWSALCCDSMMLGRGLLILERRSAVSFRKTLQEEKLNDAVFTVQSFSPEVTQTNNNYKKLSVCYIPFQSKSSQRGLK